MRKGIIILVISVFSVLYYLGVLSHRDTLPFSKDFFTDITPSSTDQVIDLKVLWPDNGKNRLADGAVPGAGDLDRIHQVALDQGVQNLPILSSLLIREAEQASARGDHKQAVRLANRAVAFSPELPQPYFALAKAQWRQAPLHLEQSLPDVLKGLSAQVTYYPTSLRLAYNAFYILSNAILMASLLFSIMVIIKYLPLYFYDIRKNLSKEISGLILNSLKIFVLFIPFILRLDMLWAVLFWSILLWGYISKRERHLIAIFLILLVYLPFSLRQASAFLNGPSADILHEIHRANHEAWNKATEQKLQAWLINEPHDTDVLFTLGLIEKRQGHYPEAEKFYQAAIQFDPGFSDAHSNLGNVFFARQDIGAAVASYEKAVGLDPTQAAYFYNLHKAYAKQTFLSGKSGQAFERARKIDPDLVDQYARLDEKGGEVPLNRLLIDATVDTKRLWKRSYACLVGREGILFPLFKAWFEHVPSRLPALAPLVFLLFILAMSRYRQAKRFLTRCPMCGSPTHRFYLGASDQEFICFNCHRIFIQKEKLHPKMVEKKTFQVQQFQRESHVIARFLSFFFVGYGYLWRGYYVRGFLLLFLFFIFLLRFIYWNGIIAPEVMPGASPSWSWAVWGGVFFLIYVFTLRQTVRLQPRFESVLKDA